VHLRQGVADILVPCYSEDGLQKIVKLYKAKCEQLNVAHDSAVLEQLRPQDEKGAVPLETISLDSSVDYHWEGVLQEAKASSITPLKASLNSLAGRTFSDQSLPPVASRMGVPTLVLVGPAPPSDGHGDGGVNALVTALLLR
jgi:hypothetical protein